MKQVDLYVDSFLKCPMYCYRPTSLMNFTTGTCKGLCIGSYLVLQLV
jgi:hypothetical protein